MLTPPVFDGGPPPGIVFSGVVAFIIAVVAGMFAIFLFGRWRRLDALRRAYAWFWFFTTVLWVGITVRYAMVQFGLVTPWVYWGNEVLLQTSVFLMGIPLFKFLTLQLFDSKLIDRALMIFSSIGAAASIWFLVMPGGITPGVITQYTIEPGINPTSALLFGLLAGSALLLILAHAILQFFSWFRSHAEKFPYNILFSLSLIVYIVLGSIDQLNAITGWPVVVFRILYIGVFLVAYIVTIEDERRREQYLVVAEPGRLV